MISGAGSGIGRALAIAYCRPDVNLFLCGRNLQKLQETKSLCEALKANVYLRILDVRNAEDVKKYVEEIEEKFALDLVIANAGISAGTASGTESLGQIKEIFATNIDGVINLTHPASEKMKQRQCGQIAIVSSLAGFRGLPSSPAYSASKAAVRLYGEALRGNLKNFGIAVNVICPGYVKSPMTAVNDFPMPFLMSAEKCAKIIKRGLSKNQARISFPFPLFFVVWLCALLSPRITDPIFAKLPGKKALEKQ